MSAICVIPARGGSRRIPGKNTKVFHGLPIIAYSLLAAKESGLFERIVVSTDDRLAAMVAWDYGASIQFRPAALAVDEVGTQEVMRYVLAGLSYGYACCVYPCAPMMTAEDLSRARDWLSMTNGIGYGHIPGWFYFAKTDTFLAGIPVEESAPMTAPPNRYIDINTPEDFLKAEMMYTAWTDRILGRT